MAKILLAERNKRVGAPHRGSVGCSVCSVQQVGLTAVPGGVYRSTVHGGSIWPRSNFVLRAVLPNLAIAPVLDAAR